MHLSHVNLTDFWHLHSLTYWYWNELVCCYKKYKAVVVFQNLDVMFHVSFEIFSWKHLCSFNFIETVETFIADSLKNDTHQNRLEQGYYNQCPDSLRVPYNILKISLAHIKKLLNETCSSDWRILIIFFIVKIEKFFLIHYFIGFLLILYYFHFFKKNFRCQLLIVWLRIIC